MTPRADVDVLQKAIETKLPQPWSEWPGGYPDEIEIALLDAVLSIRASYGKSHNGVWGATTRYRKSVTSDEAASLTREVARRLDEGSDAVSPLLTRLDHQIWLTARGRTRD